MKLLKHHSQILYSLPILGALYWVNSKSAVSAYFFTRHSYLPSPLARLFFFPNSPFPNEFRPDYGNGRKLVKDGCVYTADKQSAKNILQRPLYAGYISIPKWVLFLHPDKHEALIDFATWKRIQERIEGRPNVPARVDLHEDFPLRNFVTCNCCEDPMTAGWSKGRSQKYAYYFCKTKGCSEHRKSIRKEAIEIAFEATLRSLQPLPSLFPMAKVMFTDLWDLRLKAINADKSPVEAEITPIMAKMAN